MHITRHYSTKSRIRSIHFEIRNRVNFIQFQLRHPLGDHFNTLTYSFDFFTAIRFSTFLRHLNFIVFGTDFVRFGTVFFLFGTAADWVSDYFFSFSVFFSFLRYVCSFHFGTTAKFLIHNVSLGKFNINTCCIHVLCCIHVSCVVFTTINTLFGTPLTPTDPAHLTCRMQIHPIFKA